MAGRVDVRVFGSIAAGPRPRWGREFTPLDIASGGAVRGRALFGSGACGTGSRQPSAPEGVEWADGRDPRPGHALRAGMARRLSPPGRRDRRRGSGLVVVKAPERWRDRASGVMWQNA
ncbi:hypothetical protein HBB16_05330 [Pseudonocardia sp. MCCB 268]|nr:hypothetical protein [Pseudonocardia cytotoxica]